MPQHGSGVSEGVWSQEEQSFLPATWERSLQPQAASRTGCYPVHTSIHRATISYLFPLTRQCYQQKCLHKVSCGVTAVLAPLRYILTQLPAAGGSPPCSRWGGLVSYSRSGSQVTEIQIYADWPQTLFFYFSFFLFHLKELVIYGFT